MKIEAEVMRTKLETVDHLCNFCGESCKINDYFFGLINAKASGSYSSPYLGDGDLYEFSLCEKCLTEKLLEKFIIPAKVGNSFFFEESKECEKLKDDAVAKLKNSDEIIIPLNLEMYKECVVSHAIAKASSAIVLLVVRRDKHEHHVRFDRGKSIMIDRTSLHSFTKEDLGKVSDKLMDSLDFLASV